MQPQASQRRDSRSDPSEVGAARKRLAPPQVTQCPASQPAGAALTPGRPPAGAGPRPRAARARSRAASAIAHELREAERSEEHTSELQSRENLVCRRLLEKK